MNGPANVKSELRIMTVEDAHFTMWKEFIERHHRGELINPDTCNTVFVKLGDWTSPKIMCCIVELNYT